MAPGPGPLATASAAGPIYAALPQTGGAKSPPSGSGSGNIAAMIAREESDAAQQVANEVKEFLMIREGSSLRAWLRHFDVNHDQKISLSEFIRGMRKMNFVGDVTGIFSALDTDKSGELSLEELDVGQASLWRRFRAWCVETFEGVQEMMNLLNDPADSSFSERRPTFVTKAQMQGAADDVISSAEFREGLRKAGWDGGFEDVLFLALDTDDKGFLEPAQFKWLEIEKRRQKRKEQAKKRAMLESARHVPNWKAADATLSDFKTFLKRKYGHFIRAWRCALSPDGAMVLQKADLFKACAKIGWPGDVRLLYKAFDKDGSGYISIEELDPKSAENLARFRLWIEQRFGSSSAAFRALDRYKTKKLRKSEFLNAVKAHGFVQPAKLLFHGLDIHGTGGIVEEDLAFLDRWKPPPYLLVPANPQAAEDVKVLLIKHFKNFLKAWRHVLDVDASNMCSYDEFEAACKKMSFKGDVPGAWRALDEDFSGFITLHELDPVSSDTLKVFRRWCDQEFGSVRSAFGVFDTSGDNEVTYREFRRSCRVYGFQGNVHTLFHALDTERNGTLSMDEVAFLDEWEFFDDTSRQGSEDSDAAEPEHELKRAASTTVSNLIEFTTDGPGPGAYSMPSTVGAGPGMPMVRFNGAFSFRRRLQVQLPDVAKDGGPSPASYDDRLCWGIVAPSKPSWVFGTEPRRVLDPVMPKVDEPGPGQYSPSLRNHGFGIACTPRRPLRVHPLLRTHMGWDAGFRLGNAVPALLGR